jgi:hypothetical protein
VSVPTADLSTHLRRNLLALCLRLAAEGGRAAEIDLMPVDTDGLPALSTDEVRLAVLDVWRVLCRDDRRWSFPPELSLRCPDGQILHFTAADLPEFPTETVDVSDPDVGAALAAHRTGVSIVPVPADAFPGRRSPTALLRRGPDDIGDYAVFETVTGGGDRVAEVREKILAARERLADVGGGEVVLDARDGKPLASHEAYHGYVGAVEAAKDNAGRLPTAVTVVLPTTSIRLETPEDLRGNPPVRLLVTPPDKRTPVSRLGIELAEELQGRLEQHRDGQGFTVTLAGGGPRDYATRVIWTAASVLPVFRVRSDDERFNGRDAIALTSVMHAKLGWRVLVVMAGRTIHAEPSEQPTPQHHPRPP